MTAIELLHTQVDSNLSQLSIIFATLKDEDLDFKPAPNALTFSDHLIHLAEVCVACTAEKHRWGSYEAPDKTLKGLIQTFESLRKSTLEKLFADGSPESLKSIGSYFAQHEQYHVGQLCLSLQVRNPEWSSFAIYG